MKNRILFYSSVPTKKMFSIQKYYKTDIQILKDLGYSVFLSSNFYDFFLFWKYDIAFIYFYRYGLLPAIISKLYRKKVIFTGGIDYLDREYAGLKKFVIQKIFFRLCILFSDKNILVSNADRNNILTFKNLLTDSKFPLSFHVIDGVKFKNGDLSIKEKLLCTIAWMVNPDNVFRKGVDRSIYLFKKIHQLDNEYRMIIIGPKGKGSEYIEELIKKEKLEHFVTLTGAIEEDHKINILKRSTFYTQLSQYEGFGIAAIEALLSGNIVVHSGKGGLSDGVGENGIIVRNESDSEIAKTLIKIPINKQYHKEMVDKGISHVTKNFMYEKRQSDFKNIFKNL